MEISHWCEQFYDGVRAGSAKPLIVAGAERSVLREMYPLLPTE
ncbi:similar to An09g05655 [Aspergillus luchuensis]|uniref:Similar to An09g05655 n=1 Tax=Aspergillus kawachii TaxID=1069201 RepID=A0A146F2U9_ASPKA|nr:similar to An09g05655 [Aspergillus luchuensis]